MNLNEKYSRAREGKNLSDRYPIRNGLKEADTLLPFLFNFALECAVRMVQANQESCKLNGRYQLSVYVDNASTMGETGLLQRKTQKIY